MATRTTMVAILKRLQRIIGDDVTAPLFDYTMLQDVLDGHRLVVRNAFLRPDPTPLPMTGYLQYLDFYADRGDWEDGAQLYNVTFSPITADVVDLLTGHWTFITNQLPNMFLTGQSYDLNGAAADLLENWAAKLTGEYDFKTNNTLFSRSQQIDMKLRMAEKCRLKQWPALANMVRDDVTGFANGVKMGDVRGF